MGHKNRQSGLRAAYFYALGYNKYILYLLLREDRKMSFDMRNRAHEQYKLMNNYYRKEIKTCVEKTRVYREKVEGIDERVGQGKFNRVQRLEDCGTYDAIMSCTKAQGRVAALNFASFKNPGGGFMNGSTAQEEMLCHDSFLYNVLEKETDFYEENRKDVNKGMYYNAALYSPDVTFVEADAHGIKREKACDIITCAAPNWSAASKNHVSISECNKALRERIEFILDVAQANHVDTLILGAFGCGVFRNDPRVVVETFEETLNKEKYTIREVIYAVPNKKSDNYKAFEAYLSKEE